MSDPRPMSGKTVLLTGATMGIGRQTAEALAAMGPRLVLVGRDAAKLDATVKELQVSAGNPDIEGMVADLSSQASIRRLAADFKAKHARLEVLINNAGGIFMERSETLDGLERTFALNHLGYFLLTELLLDLLKASAPARVVSVSSAAHLMGKIDFEDLQGAKRYSGWKAYGQSKLANILFTRELARRLAGTGVTANCLHPGGVNTGFGKNTPGIFKALVSLVSPLLLSARKAARTPVYLASSPDVAGVTGEYFVKTRKARTSGAAKDLELARRLWDVSEALTRGSATSPLTAG